MPPAAANVTVNNFEIGPCRVTYDGVDLGGTLSNVVVNFKYEKAKLMADQYGNTLLDEAISGMEVTVETEIAEVKDKDTLKKVHLNYVFLQNVMTQQAIEVGALHPAGKFKILSLEHYPDDQNIVTGKQIGRAHV